MNNSRLLTLKDNERLREMIHSKGALRGVAVARLYFGINGTWIKQCAGAVTIERLDQYQKIAICVYDFEKSKQEFRSFLYREMLYTTSTSNFSYFYGETHPVGLCFASNQEAQAFNSQVIYEMNYESNENLNNRTQRRSSAASVTSNTKKLKNATSRMKDKFNPMKLSIFNKKPAPGPSVMFDQSSFKCVKHVGLSSANEFSVSANDEQTLLELLDMFGIKMQSDRDLQDVYELVTKEGGMGKLKEALGERTCPDPVDNRTRVPNPPSLPCNDYTGGNTIPPAPANVPAPPPPPPAPNEPPPRNTSGGTGFLDEIANFKKNTLRAQESIEQKTPEQKPASGDLLNTLGTALMQLMANRRAQLQSDSESDNDFDN